MIDYQVFEKSDFKFDIDSDKAFEKNEFGIYYKLNINYFNSVIPDIIGKFTKLNMMQAHKVIEDIKEGINRKNEFVYNKFLVSVLERLIPIYNGTQNGGWHIYGFKTRFKFHLSDVERDISLSNTAEEYKEKLSQRIELERKECEKRAEENKQFAIKIKKLTYPYNLLMKIFEHEDYDFYNRCVRNKSILENILEEVIETLPPREAKVLRLRFGLEDEKIRILEQVGIELGVSRERIRQLEAQAIRKLRHPSRSKRIYTVLYNKTKDILDTEKYQEDVKEFLNIIFRHSEEYLNKDNVFVLLKSIQCKLNKYKENYIANKNKLDEVLQDLQDYCESYNISKKYDMILSLKLEDLEFSVRTYHCLYRAGVKTLYDIFSMNDLDFMRIRNLGQKSFNEIHAKLAEYGLKRRD